MEDIKDDEKFEKIKVFSSDDEKLKILGELLSNKSSRDIIRLLIEKEMYTNEIANKLEIRPNLVVHHLKKLEELGLLEIKLKKISKKGNEHKHFRMTPYLFILPKHTRDKIKEVKMVKKIFRNGIKFIAIGICSVVGGILTDKFSMNRGWRVAYEGGGNQELFPIVISLSIIIAGLLLINSYEFFKKRRKG